MTIDHLALDRVEAAIRREALDGAERLAMEHGGEKYASVDGAPGDPVAGQLAQ